MVMCEKDILYRLQKPCACVLHDCVWQSQTFLLNHQRWKTKHLYYKQTIWNIFNLKVQSMLIRWSFPKYFTTNDSTHSQFYFSQSNVLKTDIPFLNIARSKQYRFLFESSSRAGNQFVFSLLPLAWFSIYD